MMGDERPLAPAHDELERYYTEKAWDWVPSVYKDEDGLAARPDVLRSIVEILACQAAIARRSVDRLWEDQFIELCDDWAVAYLGDLLGTRLVHELNRRGRRVDVAKTIFYRRRKGTLLVLESLIRDIAEWDGAVVESFPRLARTRHRLDPEPLDLEGRRTGTPPGGWARLNDPLGVERVDGPFDELSHTPDFRQLRGHLGRYNIPKLNVYLFRQRPFEVKLATPGHLGDHRYTFDPSGRDIPLFRPAQRGDARQCGPLYEWQLPAPIPCRLLGAASYMITTAVLDRLIADGLPQTAADELARYLGVLFRDEARLRRTVDSLDGATEILAHFDTLLGAALSEESPKGRLIPSPIQSDPSAVAVATGLPDAVLPVEHQEIVAGNLEDWGTNLGTLPPEKTLVIDPSRGRFWFSTPPEPSDSEVWVPLYHYGFLGPIGAGTYDRRESIIADGTTEIVGSGGNPPGPVDVPIAPPPLSGIFEFVDSKTYYPADDVEGVDKLTIQAKNFNRPYLKRLTTGERQWKISAEPKVDDPPEVEDNLRFLTLDGLWIGIDEEGAAPGPPGDPCKPLPADFLLEGVFDRVVIRHCTLDPGGEKARVEQTECQTIPYVRILVRGIVEELVIESSIIGPIAEDKAGGADGKIQKLTIRDSIVHSIDAENVAAIDTRQGEVELQRVTVFGGIEAKRVYASEALIQGVVRVDDNQNGCFRFSATDDHPEKRVPPSFESHFFEPRVPNHFFVSRRFGDPGYAQLSNSAPPVVLRGAENRSEIGTFSGLHNPLKRDDLKAKVNEYMPFGLIAQYINER